MLRRAKLRRVTKGCLQPNTWLGLAMIALIWSGVEYDLRDDFAKANGGATQTTGNLAQVFEAHTLAVLRELDQTLRLARSRYLADPADFDLASFTHDPAVSGGSTLQIGLIGADGLLKMNGTGRITTRVDLGDREHFKVLREAKEDTLFVSKPIRYRTTEQWAIQVARAVRGADGTFLGVIGVMLDPIKLSTFYDTIDLGADGAIMLVGLDGVVRAAAGFRQEMVGRSMLQRQLFKHLATAPSGTFVTAGTSDGVSRLVSYRILRGLPLALYVGVSRDTMLAEYRQSRRIFYTLASGLTLLVMAGISLGFRYRVRLEVARDSLAASEARATEKSHELAVTLDHMNQGIMMVDSAKNIAVINRRLVDLLDLPPEFLGGRRKHDDLLSLLWSREEFGRDGELLEPQVHRYLRSNPLGTDVGCYQRVRPNGTVLEINTEALPGGGLVRTFTDVTEQQRNLDRIAQLARHDSLTGLANRSLLAERIEQALARLRRYGEWFAVMCIDLDRFKAVNDGFGHAVGDMLLKMVAKRLRQNVRETDTVARIGGDEFAVLVTPAAFRDGLATLAGRLVEVLGLPYEFEGKTASIGASIGIAMAVAADERAEQLLQKADLALYRVKAEGRNAFRLFADEMEAEIHAGRTLEIELRHALQHHEFVLWYQPIVDLSSNAVSGLEALIRWNHPERGLLGPDHFVARAEQCGLITQIGEWAIRRACTDAVSLPGNVKVAVNLSSQQFHQPGLVDTVVAALQETGLSPTRLELEITETVVLEENALSLSTLTELREIGVGIALDDFGTGYSSLSYLRAFPFDKMKIDRSFVSELSQRADCAAIVSAIAGLGISLGVRTTAEGVETEAQASFVRVAGCSEAQGYLFGRPMPIEDVVALLQGKDAAESAVA